ncbi:Regulatory-associated protein of TOR 1-like protein [Drosera capensis]
MALGDLMSTRFSHSSVPVSNHLDECSSRDEGGGGFRRDLQETACSSSGGVCGNVVMSNMTSTIDTGVTSMAYLPQTVVLCELRHDGFEASSSSQPAEVGFVSKWRPKDRMKTGMVALVVCMNITVDPPDAQYKYRLDPTIEEVKKLCTSCHNLAKNERVVFHYTGHGVPKPTANGEIWIFNESYTQYIPLAVRELDSLLKTPSIYVFDCSAAGNIVNAFLELNDASSSSGSPPDCILLAACEAHEDLPQSPEFPADVFTSCLTTPIQMTLRWLHLKFMGLLAWINRWCGETWRQEWWEEGDPSVFCISYYCRGTL